MLNGDFVVLYYGHVAAVFFFFFKWIYISDKKRLGDLPGGPVVKNPPSNVGNTG